MKYKRTALAVAVFVISIAFFLLCMGILLATLAGAEIVGGGRPVFHVATNESNPKDLPTFSDWCDLNEHCYWIGACWGPDYRYSIWIQGWPVCGDLKIILCDEDNEIMVPMNPQVARWIGDQLTRHLEEALP